MITFSCSACGQNLKVKDEFAGKSAACPHCKQRLTVPAPAAVAAPAGLKNAKTAVVLDAPTKESEAVSAPTHNPLDTSTSGAPAAPAAKHDAYEFLSPPQGPGELGRLGGYRILKLLGEGGMGMVFKAEDVSLSRPVALKVMRPEQAKNPSAHQRFLREAKTTAAVKHDHIVSIYQVGEDRGVPYLAMEFLQGEPLDSWLKKNKPTLSQALRLGRDIAKGLAAAHERGLIHRDIKPANIWLEAPGGRVKILDFGLARTGKEETRLTQMGAILGTPAFMSPEQARADKVDARTDLFSLGCILYRLCTGAMPFQGESVMSLLMALATVDPKPPQEVNPAIPPALADLVMKLLAKKPEDRFATAKAVVEAIQAIEKAKVVPVKSPAAEHAPVAPTLAEMPKDFDAGQDKTTSIPRTRTADPAAASRLRRRVVIAALLVLLLGGAGLLGWSVLTHWDEGSLVVETDDPDIEIMVKQGGKSVTIIDPKTRRQIELKSGTYELALVDDSKGLRLSTKQFTLQRGGREVVKVSLEAAANKKTETKPAARVQPKANLEPRPEPPPPPAVVPRPKAKFEPPPEPPAPPAVVPQPMTNITPRPEPRLVPPAVVDPVKPTPMPDVAPPPQQQPVPPQNPMEIRRFDVRQGRLFCVAFAPDGKEIVCDGGSHLLVWDVKSGNRLFGLQGHKSGIYSVVFSADGRFIVTAGQDKTVRLWDASNGKEVRVFQGHEGEVHGVAISRDGQHILSGGGGVRFEGNRPIPFDSTVRLWNATTGEEIKRFDCQDYPVKSVALSPDGRQALACSSKIIHQWDVASGKEIRRFEGHTQTIRSLAISPDGRRLLSGSQDKSLRLWDLDNGQEIRHFPDKRGMVFSVAFSPDGRYALAGYGSIKFVDNKAVADDNSVRIWDAANGRLVRGLSGFPRFITCVAFSRDGRQALFGCDDSSMYLWDLANTLPAANQTNADPAPSNPHPVPGENIGPRHAPVEQVEPAKALRFIDRGDCVEDTRTGLLWQKDGIESGKLNYYDAVKYAARQNLGGLTGWRIPTKEELAPIFPATEVPFKNTRYVMQPMGAGDWNSYWVSNPEPRGNAYAYVYHWYGKGGANNCLAGANLVYVKCHSSKGEQSPLAASQMRTLLSSATALLSTNLMEP